MLGTLPSLTQGSKGGAGNVGNTPSYMCKTFLRRMLGGSCSADSFPTPSPIPWRCPFPALPTFTTRMYPSGGRRLISFFSCSTARTRSMTLLYTVSSVRSRLAVGVGWMDCGGTGTRWDQMDRGGKEGKINSYGEPWPDPSTSHPRPRCCWVCLNPLGPGGVRKVPSCRCRGMMGWRRRNETVEMEEEDRDRGGPIQGGLTCAPSLGGFWGGPVNSAMPSVRKRKESHSGCSPGHAARPLGPAPRPTPPWSSVSHCGWTA